MGEVRKIARDRKLYKVGSDTSHFDDETLLFYEKNSFYRNRRVALLYRPYKDE